MKRLNEDFPRWIPLCLMRKDDTIYYQTQIAVAREDGACAGVYADFDKIDAFESDEQIGAYTLALLKRFHSIGVLTEKAFVEWKGMSITEYQSVQDVERFAALHVDSLDELHTTFEHISICYDREKRRYDFSFTWTYPCGDHFCFAHAHSTGIENDLTFDTILEFDDQTPAKQLGQLIATAFERRKQLAARATGNFSPTKSITAKDGTVLHIKAPRSIKFADYSDNAQENTYQVYAYIPAYKAKSSAAFTIGDVPSLSAVFTFESIREYLRVTCHASDEQITISQTSCGIFRFRGEVQNQQTHTITYFTSTESGLILQCSMNVIEPNRRKKLDAKLSAMFSKFAANCKL